ncbi:Hypothetical predicted protein [Octopus vulgaris]|uniref:Uncharacterized protein n=1 Tax=Octopus vulgaris TaxID=6645 RepID=A0AA36AJL5_OCTVU|nr:Hypothetical predicted protein [Octopus vulgaris]
MTSLNIMKQLGRDHRTTKKTIEDITKNRKRRSGKGFNNLSTRDKRQLKRIVAKDPLLSSDKIFNMAGIIGVKRDIRCRVLHDIGSGKSPRQLLVSPTNIDKHLKSARMYLKTGFRNIIFTDESHVTLDGPDGWAKGWLLSGQDAHLTRIRQQVLGWYC